MDRKEKSNYRKTSGIKPKYLSSKLFEVKLPLQGSTISDKVGDEMKLDEILNSSEKQN